MLFDSIINIFCIRPSLRQRENIMFNSKYKIEKKKHLLTGNNLIRRKKEKST